VYGTGAPAAYVVDVPLIVTVTGCVGGNPVSMFVPAL
jgi:hypothetical protein